MEFAAPAALSTRAAELSTTCQSPPRPPSRRPPTGASGSRHYYDYDHVLFRAGWFLDEPHFGPQNGVRLTSRGDGSSLVVTWFTVHLLGPEKCAGHGDHTGVVGRGRQVDEFQNFGPV
jgi:hypothetical protein